MSAPTPDPVFRIGSLREATLRAWRESPTRRTEDTNAEHDLRVGGYRDRLFVELAQNAADAAALTGVPGRVRVTVAGAELRVANTGAPLDAAGVAALSSLRASAKREDSVGRFGVGFAAVLAATTEPRVVSRDGGVAFSQARTRAAVGTGEPVPVLRLPWELPGDEPSLPAGFDTEVRLPLKAGVDPSVLLREIAAEVPDVLLALPWLAEVDVAGECWARTAHDRCVELTSPGGERARWLTQAGDGGTWAVPVDAEGVPQPLTDDVLRVPTPTDERLSLPARLLAPVPVEPSRRRVLAGADSTAALESAARNYPALVRLVPAEHRLGLVPRARLPLSGVDASLRALVLGALSAEPWLPAASGAEVPAAGARVLTVDSPALVALLTDLVPGLAAAPLCGQGAAKILEVAGARGVGVAELVEVVTGIEREPRWWRTLYEALLAAVEERAVAVDELGALPVPLADGRTVPGPRGALLLDDVQPMSGLDVVGLHVVDGDAAHPLLERLGATRAGPGELLDSPAVRESIERSVADAESGMDVRPLVDTVLRLASAGTAGGLGALALPARTGWRRADELVLPAAGLLRVLDPDALGDDAPLDVLDDGFAAAQDAGVLAAVGVLETFAVVVDEEPVGPDHDLPDEDEWWSAASTAEPPAELLAVRDLDLVADDAWPEALRLLAARPETYRALTLPGGHTSWWLARYALLGGAPPRHWRLRSAESLAGLFEAVPDVGLPEHLLAALGVRAELAPADAEDAGELCARLGDPEREVSPGLAMRAHAALAAAGMAPEPPERVRALDGSVADAGDAAVLDGPWQLAVWPAGRLVALPGFAAAPALADVLDLPSAGEETAAAVTSLGEFATWDDLPAIGEVAGLLGVECPPGGVLVHERLLVGEQPVPWWFDGALHATDSAEGLARAFAWAVDRWPDRLLVEALLEDPDPRTLLA